MACGNAAETQSDLRRHPRKSLKINGGNVLRKRAETAETLRQVIENKAETETETYLPLTGRTQARTPARCNYRAKRNEAMNLKNAIKPVGLPPIGLAIEINGQRFDCVAHAEYPRADGTKVECAVWQAECATCGEGFTSRTIAGRFAETRRCEKHRSPGKRVSAPRNKRSL